MTKYSLDEKLNIIKKVFNISDVLKTSLNPEYIKKYYKVNQIAYSFLHTSSDRMYMGITRDGNYRDEDLLDAARTVEKSINNNTKNVLELASGRGATSFYLAQKYPKIIFNGIELSPGQLH